MILPRRLMKLEDGSFCEENDPAQAMNFHGAGFVIPDAEAERIGLKAYLDQTGYGAVADEPHEQAVESKPVAMPEEKAVAQDKVEDKAVEAPTEAKSEPDAEDESLTPGLHIQTESRRTPGGGRRGGV